MDVGRELDAMIAEKVMGFATFIAARQLHFTDPTNAMRTPVVPFYSTDIGSAFLVVEKMREGGLMFRVDATSDDAGGETWSACFWLLDDATRDEHWASTAPHAICLAALGALDP